MALPHVVSAEHRGGYRIHLTFSDGLEKTVDFQKWLYGPVFEPLKDPSYFARFFVDAGTVAWPNGADIAPETLHAAKECPQAAGSWPGATALDAWFRVTWNDDEVSLDVEPPGRTAWTASFPWSSVMRVCFKAEGLEASDGIYVFTSLRPESFVIPVEASGGLEVWNEIVRRRLFDAGLAVKVASLSEGLVCWPADESQ
jgi:hypothetical protein